MMILIIIHVVFCLAVAENAVAEGNISCYQCIRNTPEPCPEETLAPCPVIMDRCVTHYSKDEKNGYIMKKECGLGPCGFEDDMVNKGLGLADQCDTSKDEYFCVFCCKETGCNSATNPKLHFTLLTLFPVIVFMWNKYRTLKLTNHSLD